MSHPSITITVRAGLLALTAFLAAWQAADFTTEPHVIAGAVIAALMGWLNPARPDDQPAGE